MDGRWKLEVWLDADLTALQVNTVLVDAYGKLLEVVVVPVEPSQEISKLVAEVMKLLRARPKESALFDGSEWAYQDPRA